MTVGRAVFAAWDDEMPEPSRRAARGAAWGVVAVVLGAAVVAAWYSVPQPEPGNWLAWLLSSLTIAAVYACFADPLGLWPVRPRPALDLVPEASGDQLRLSITNRGPAVACSAQVTSNCQPPIGRPKGLQHWPVPWLDDHSVEPKQILPGQTRTLDFAMFNSGAVREFLHVGQGAADHWSFASAPEPVGVRYYNPHSVADIDEQEFTLTLRILIADSGRYLDWQLTVKAKNLVVACELAPVKDARYRASWHRGTSAEAGSARARQASA
jgi:hypothetical protein